MPAPLRHSSAARAATLTMRPPAPVLLRVMAFTAARQHSAQLTKFMSICCRSVATLVSRSGAAAKPPARWIEAHSGAMPS